MVTARKLSRARWSAPRPAAPQEIDLGFVGEPARVDTTVLDQVLGRDLIPVLAPVAQGEDGETYNVNADTFAGAIAGALRAKRLMLLDGRTRACWTRKSTLIKALQRRRDPRSDRRRHDYGRHDPQGRDLHLCVGTGRRRRGDRRRQGPTCGSGRAPDRPRRRDADHAVNALDCARMTQQPASLDREPEGPAADLRSRFAAVDAWVFDLDNTLYPAGSDRLAEDRRAHHALPAALFGIDGLSAAGIAEILLPTLRHDAARPDAGPRDLAARPSSTSCTTSIVRRCARIRRWSQPSGRCRAAS